MNSARVDEAQAVFDARSTVGNLGEVVFAQLLLFFEAERTMIGGNHLQRILGQSLPEFFLVPFFAQRRREDVLRSFKSWNIEIFKRKIEVLRTGLGISGQSAVARLADLLESVVAGEMDDIDRPASHFRKRNRPRSGF